MRFIIRKVVLGLPDRDYYLKPDFAAQKAQYLAYVSQLLHLVNWPDADARAKDMVDFETKLADASWTKVQQRDISAIYNPMKVADLQKFTPGFDWKGFLAASGLEKFDRVIVAEKTAFPKLAAIYAKTPLLRSASVVCISHRRQRGAISFQGIHRCIFRNARQDTCRPESNRRCAGNAAYGRCRVALAADDRFGNFGTMGFGVGKLYTAQYFPPEAKAKIEELAHQS